VRYMLLVYGAGPDAEPDGSAPPAAETEPCWIPWADQLAQLGVEMHDGAMLRDAAVATTVRGRGDDVLLSDGPFAETKEQIIGYQVIECADLDAAIEAAARHPAVGGGCAVEVRPIAEE
jgi:hypothetical protein